MKTPSSSSITTLNHPKPKPGAQTSNLRARAQGGYPKQSSTTTRRRRQQTTKPADADETPTMKPRGGLQPRPSSTPDECEEELYPPRRFNSLAGRPRQDSRGDESTACTVHTSSMPPLPIGHTPNRRPDLCTLPPKTTPPHSFRTTLREKR